MPVLAWNFTVFNRALSFFSTLFWKQKQVLLLPVHSLSSGLQWTQQPPFGSLSHNHVLSTNSLPKRNNEANPLQATYSIISKKEISTKERMRKASLVIMTTHLFLLGITPICSLSPCGVTSLACHHSSSEALITCRMSP